MPVPNSPIPRPPPFPPHGYPYVGRESSGQQIRLASATRRNPNPDVPRPPRRIYYLWVPVLREGVLRPADPPRLLQFGDRRLCLFQPNLEHIAPQLASHEHPVALGVAAQTKKLHKT